ncbi:MAG: helix-turn-helix domain-containing protein [Microthrixaceae bacterium]
MPTVMVLDNPDVLATATHPVRAAILDAMRRPSTAAEVARAIGQTRQNTAYHVRELEKAGLLRHVEGQRQKGNFLPSETTGETATPLAVSPTCTWGNPQLRAEALADQLSLSALFEAGERLQNDSARLLDRAAFGRSPSASVVTDIRFASEDSRAAFLTDYTDALAALAHKHGSRTGSAFKLVLAAREPGSHRMTPADGFEATFRMSLPRRGCVGTLDSADTGADSDAPASGSPASIRPCR